jgi:hypothetical protein
LRAAFSVSSFLGNEGGALQLGFQSELTMKHAARALEDQRLSAALEATFGGPLEVELKHAPDGRGARTLAEELDRLRGEQTARLEADARAHAAVTAVTKVFPGASIRRVETPPIEEIHDVQ